MQMVDRMWLKKWNACWRESQIKALALDSDIMSAADIVSNVRISNSDKQWVICRLLVEQSPADLVTYANFCRDSAKKHAAYAAAAADAAYAAYAADAANAADAAYAAANAAYAAANAADAAYDAAYAAAAADAAAAANAAANAAYAAAAYAAAAYAANAAAYAAAYAARNKEHRKNLEFALTLLK